MRASLSKDYSYTKIWTDSSFDIGSPQNDPLYVNRIGLVNRAQKAVLGLFYDVMAPAYKDSEMVLTDVNGNYYSSGASYVAVTRALTVTMNAVFTSADVGKLVMFRNGALVYLCTVQSYVSATSIIVQGANLPAANIATVNYVMMAATTLSGDSLDISNLRMMMTGQQVGLIVECSETTLVEPITLEKYKTWSPSNPSNINKVVYCLVGSTLLLKKGMNISSYGTLTIYFSGIQNLGTLDADMVDLPDGPAIELCLIKLKQIRYEQYNQLGMPVKPLSDTSAQTQELVTGLYRIFGRQEIAEDVVQDKIRALKAA